jgi:hypothetical protein
MKNKITLPLIREIGDISDIQRFRRILGYMESYLQSYGEIRDRTARVENFIEILFRSIFPKNTNPFDDVEINKNMAEISTAYKEVWLRDIAKELGKRYREMKEELDFIFLYLELVEYISNPKKYTESQIQTATEKLLSDPYFKKCN